MKKNSGLTNYLGLILGFVLLSIFVLAAFNLNDDILFITIPFLSVVAAVLTILSALVQRIFTTRWGDIINHFLSLTIIYMLIHLFWHDELSFMESLEIYSVFFVLLGIPSFIAVPFFFKKLKLKKPSLHISKVLLFSILGILLVFEFIVSLVILHGFLPILRVLIILLISIAVSFLIYIGKKFFLKKRESFLDFALVFSSFVLLVYCLLPAVKIFLFRYLSVFCFFCFWVPFIIIFSSISIRVSQKSLKKSFVHFRVFWNKFLSAPFVKKYLLNFKIYISIFSFILLYSLFGFILPTKVTNYEPKNVASVKTTIAVTFSKDIIPRKQDIETPMYGGNTNSQIVLIKKGIEYFSITPHIEGRYQIEKNRTIRFIPDSPLKLSTRYKVKVRAKAIHSKTGLIYGKSFSFISTPFQVVSARAFYNMDLIKNIEKELICEINFNDIVDINTLKKYLSVFWENDQVDYKLETSGFSNRFYVKIRNIKRKDNRTEFRILIKKGLLSKNATIGLTKSYVKTINLPATVKLEVLSLQSFPVEDATYLAVQFNRPVSKRMLRRNTLVYLLDDDYKSKIIPVKIETEYCYAILKASFIPNTDYILEIDEGTRAKTGEKMTKIYKTHFSVRDKRPEVRFMDTGHIIPLKGEMNLQLYTLNLDKFDLRIDKIYRNNLIHYFQDRNVSKYGKYLLNTSIEVTNGKLNKKVPFYINFKDLYSGKYKGLFKIQISDPGNYYNKDSKLFLITDIGLLAKISGQDLIVMAYSIVNLTPIPGVRVRLVSKENQTLQEKLTSENGKVVFKNWKYDSGGLSPSFIIAEKGDDFSYLSFARNELNITRFNIGGKIVDNKGLQAFLTPERGVYRPGDTAYITAIVRKNDLSLPPTISAKLNITDPRGAKFKLIKKKISHNGMFIVPIKFPSYAKTGTYDLELRLNDNILLGSTSLKVEEFMPDKIKVKIMSTTKNHKCGQPVSFTVQANQLFGPPASGNKVRTDLVWVDRTFSHPKFKNYTFYDSTKKFYRDSQSLGDSSLDQNGKKEYFVDVPSFSPPSALNLRVYSEVFDSGGRPVSAARTIAVNPYSIYFGLKIQKKNLYLKNVPVRISYVAINESGKYKVATNVDFLIKKKNYYTILKKYRWFRSRYESESYEEVFLHKKIKINGKGSFSFTPKTTGSYTIYLGHENGMRTVASFYVQGSGIETADLEHANNLVLKFNKNKYNIGDTATVTVLSPFKGKLFFYIEREKILYSKVINMEYKKQVVQFPITPDYTPNIYVSALVVHKPDESLRNLPMSSFAIQNVEIAPGKRKMSILLSSVNQTRSKDGLTVQGSLSSYSPNSRFVLYAVDEGILQITQFKTPNPFKFFYGKRALLTRIYSIFDSVLPNVKKHGVSIGGGDEEDYSRRHINPVKAKRVKSVALTSGLLQPDALGNFSYHFNLPDFNGQLRIMAIAADNKNFGSKAKSVIVADPIVLVPHLPRFLALDDKISVPVEVFNKTGKKGTFTIKISTKGPVKIDGKRSQTINLLDEAQKKVEFHVRAKQNAGKAVFIFSVTGNNETGSSTIELPVRPARALTTIVSNGKLESQEKTSIHIPGDFIPFGQRIRLTITDSVLTKYLRSLDYLIHYPYGCAEQTTSALYPMIFLKKLMKKFDIRTGKSGSLDYYINAGIRKLEGMQLPDGRFSYWPGGDYCNEYASDYASGFLIEAASLGYDIDQEVLNKIYEHFSIKKPKKKKKRKKLDRRRVRYSETQTYRKSIQALYLSALAGYPDYETMAYYKRKKLKDLDFSQKCQLASAFGLIGDKETALKILPTTFSFSVFRNALGGNFDSYVSRLSKYLIALMDIKPNSQNRFKIVDKIISQARNGHFGNTYNNSLALRALAKVYTYEDTKSLNFDLYIDDNYVKTVKDDRFILADNTLAGKKIEFKNNSEKPLFYTLLAEGTYRTIKMKPVNTGMRVSKTFFNADGQILNLNDVKQGDVIVVSITIDSKKNNLDNIVVSDLLPAGFEIENVRLRSRGKLNFSPKNNWQPAYEDIRDDRILLFSGGLSGTHTYSYVVRAVTPGTFSIPQVYAEAMYDPKIHSIGKFFPKLTIQKKD